MTTAKAAHEKTILLHQAGHSEGAIALKLVEVNSTIHDTVSCYTNSIGI